MNRTGLRLLGSSVLVLVLGICPMDAILSQVIMTPPTRSVETRGVTLRLPGGGQRDGRGGVRLFGDADSAKDSRVVEEALQLIPQAGLSWTASDPMVALAVAKYYLALGDEIRLPSYLLSKLPAKGGGTLFRRTARNENDRPSRNGGIGYALRSDGAGARLAPRFLSDPRFEREQPCRVRYPAAFALGTVLRRGGLSLDVR